MIVKKVLQSYMFSAHSNMRILYPHTDGSQFVIEKGCFEERFLLEFCLVINESGFYLTKINFIKHIDLFLCFLLTIQRQTSSLYNIE